MLTTATATATATAWAAPVVAPTKPRYFLYSEFDREYTELHGDPESAEFAEQLGDERTLVTVTQVAEHRYRIAAEDYYSSFGVCELVLSQPLERVMATFAALLAADTLAEAGNLHLPAVL